MDENRIIKLSAVERFLFEYLRLVALQEQPPQIPPLKSIHWNCLGRERWER